MRLPLPIVAALLALSPAPVLAQSGNEPDLASLALILVVYLALIVGFIWVALLPTIIAVRRRHRHRWLILVVNILFSATGIGWIIALIWALNSLPFTDDFHGRLGTVRFEGGFSPVRVAQASEKADDAVDQLQRLKQLHAQGVLTDIEYQRGRKPLMDHLLG